MTLSCRFFIPTLADANVKAQDCEDFRDYKIIVVKKPKGLSSLVEEVQGNE